ncbi:zinc-dependent peptidase [Chryseolinea lacunae]|uniref:Zinc-dependent peptidase n=1 Tax=Chryseolinea lacunae TaxID=2801331 RepID=A0ABS1KRZ2_9BACT|nr:zinc-dependent peptidase [Chryseolinea lacunae]MBL0742240.1 zinc-dependent peptidase [Chryseolinea lacunae]
MLVFYTAFGIAIFISLLDRVTAGSSAAKTVAPIRSQVVPVPKKVKDILQKYFTFYQQLPANKQAFFARKVCAFIYAKRFIPRSVDAVTIECKVLIAASAVQLTMGLPNIYLQHFTRILVYPNDYYSGITRRYHKGEVNPRFGIIVLSWQSFIDGYINPTDSLNLGLHEMAHALRLENIIRNDEYNFFDATQLATFDAYAKDICRNMNNGTQPFFRAYACTDEHEFFAVAVENFFERPRQFQETWPDLYAVLSKLLNQDPLTLFAVTPA